MTKRRHKNHHIVLRFSCLFLPFTHYHPQPPEIMDRKSGYMSSDTGYVFLICCRIQLINFWFSYLGVTPPIAITESNEREKEVTVTLMEELRRQNMFESEQEARIR